MDEVGAPVGLVEPEHDGGPAPAGPAGSTWWMWLLESRRVEIGLAAGLVVIGTIHLAQFVHAMATTSLWNDEIWSVLNFSSQGPGTSTSAVNNAIALNLVNSLLPGSDSLDPLRVRMVSMVAVAAMQVLGLAELARRRWYLPGALLFFVFAVNYQWLDDALQARGYGILGFCAMAASLAAWRHLEDGRRRWLVALVVASVLGVWTVPSFAFFAGPLWVLVLVLRRNRSVLVAAVAAGVVLLALYGTLLDDLWNQSASYSDVFGNQYGTVLAPYRTVRNFLFERQGGSPLALAWIVAFVAPALVVLPSPARFPRPIRGLARSMAVDAPRSTRAAVRTLLAAAVSVMVIALVLSTPPQRTVAYLVVPIAVATAISLALVREDIRLRWIGRGFTVVVAVLGCLHGAFAVSDFSFTPIENWQGAAAYLDSTFPDGTAVHVLIRGEYLAAYLDDGGSTLVDDLDQRALGDFRDGTLVVAAYDPGDDLPPVRETLFDDVPNVVEMDLPQRRGSEPRGALPLIFAPPRERSVERVTVDGTERREASDGDLATVVETEPQDQLSTPLVIDVEPTAGTTVRSLVMPVDRSGVPAAVTVELTAPDGTTTTVPSDSVVITNRLVTVAVGDREVRSIRLSIPPSARSAPVIVRDLWLYPR